MKKILLVIMVFSVALALFGCSNIKEKDVAKEKSNDSLFLSIRGDDKNTNTEKDVTKEKSDDSLFLSIRGDDENTKTQKNVTKEKSDDSLFLSIRGDDKNTNTEKDVTKEKSDDSLFLSIRGDDENTQTEKDVTADEYDNENDDYNFDDDYEDTNTYTSYYDILSKEYQNNNELIHITDRFNTHEINGVIFRYEYDDWDFMTDDGKYTSWEDVGFDCYLASFDIQSQKYNRVKLFSSNSFPDKVYDDMVIFGDHIYVTKEERIDISDNYSAYNVSLIKYDLSGKEIASCDLGECDPFKMYADNQMSINYISDNGDVCIGRHKFSDIEKVIGSDFKSINTLPAYNLKVEHGETKETVPNIFGIYNNQIFARIKLRRNDDEYIYVKYNLETNEWSEQLYEMSYHPYIGRIVGKYAYYCDDDIYTIFNMETGDTIAEINEVFMDYMTVNYTFLPNELAKFFKYGRTHIHKDNNWQEIRIYGDGSTSYNDYNVEMGHDESKDFEISVVDGEHYTLTDSYGVFLRSFADGEENEVDIVRFNK